MEYKPTSNNEIFWHSFKEMLASYCAKPLPHNAWKGVFRVRVERDGNQDVLSLQGVTIRPEGEFNVYHKGKILTGVASSFETAPLDASRSEKISDILFFDRSTGERVSGVNSVSMLKVDVFEMAKAQDLTDTSKEGDN